MQPREAKYNPHSPSVPTSVLYCRTAHAVYEGLTNTTGWKAKNLIMYCYNTTVLKKDLLINPILFITVKKYCQLLKNISEFTDLVISLPSLYCYATHRLLHELCLVWNRREGYGKLPLATAFLQEKGTRVDGESLFLFTLPSTPRWVRWVGVA